MLNLLNCFSKRIDNGGTFSSGRSTIFGVDTSFYGSYQPLSIEASSLALQVITGGRVGIGIISPTSTLHTHNTSGPSIITNSTYNCVCSSWNSSDGSTVFFGSLTNHSLQLTTNNTTRLTIASNGVACFACDLTAKTIGTNDLKLSNLNYECANYVDGTRGSWLIQEGACDLFIINQVSCKKYKFNLIEIK